jgi:hypothetical protein
LLDLKMTNSENDQDQSNSLLRTAANARFGASKKALTAFRSPNPPKEAEGSGLDDEVAKLSDTEMETGKVDGNETPVVEGTEIPKPAVTETEGMETPKPAVTETDGTETPKATTTKSFDGPKMKSKIPKFMISAAIKTTPQPRNLTPRNINPNNVEKKSMEIQKGISISAPSPMSLDRVTVQFGQERVLPVSKQFLAQLEEMEIERKEAEYQKAKEEVKRQLHSEGERNQSQKFNRFKDSPSRVAEARFLAKRALQASKRNQGMPKDMMKGVSPRNFPVADINLKQDDGSVSTMGNPQVHVLHQRVGNTRALIDQMDSVLEDGTEAAMEKAMNGCQVNNGRVNGVIGSPFDCSMGALLLGAITGKIASPEKNEIIDAEAIFLDREVQSRLNTMHMDKGIGAVHLQSSSPRSNHSMPQLEGEEKGGVIDLTSFPLPLPSAVKTDTKDQTQGISLHDGGDDDRYAVEEDGSVAEGKESSPQSWVEIAGIEGCEAFEKNIADFQKDIDTEACVDVEPLTIPGIICGALPFDFLYSTKDSQDDKKELVSKLEAISNANADHSIDGPIDEKIQKGNRKRDKVLLDSNDAYWDTLSTIASVKGFEYENIVPELTTPSPGPIPIEITMSQEEAEEKKADLSQPEASNKTEMGHKAKLESLIELELNHNIENDNKASPVTGKARGFKKAAPVKVKPMPESRSQRKKTSSGKAGKVSDSTKTNNQERGVTWGFEETYKGQESPDKLLSPKESLDYQEEQALLSRTLQLSKDLLASIANEELDEVDDDVVKSLLSFETEEESQIKLSLITPVNGIEKSSYEAPIDVYKMERDFVQESVVNTNSRAPVILSKLDVLRSQRAQAMVRFQNSKTAPTLPGIPERNHLQYYSNSNTIPVPPSKAAVGYKKQRPEGRAVFDGRDDMESPSLFSGESSRTASTKKARDLRRQLDEALNASREIRRSQEKLGSDLKTFKSSFSQKNGELEDQAIQAMMNPVIQ